MIPLNSTASSSHCCLFLTAFESELVVTEYLVTGKNENETVGLAAGIYAHNCLAQGSGAPRVTVLDEDRQRYLADEDPEDPGRYRLVK